MMEILFWIVFIFAILSIIGSMLNDIENEREIDNIKKEIEELKKKAGLK